MQSGNEAGANDMLDPVSFDGPAGAIQKQGIKEGRKAFPPERNFPGEFGTPVQTAETGPNLVLLGQ